MKQPSREDRIRRAIEAAAANLQASEVVVAASAGKPPEIGFLYVDPAGERPGRPAFWLVVHARPNHPSDKYVVPLWDRPELEHGHARLWERDREVCFPLAGVEGWGEPVVNYNQADWVADEQLSGWTLAAVFDREAARATYRAWRRLVIAPLAGAAGDDASNGHDGGQA